jgi:hypothetical protein
MPVQETVAIGTIGGQLGRAGRVADELIMGIPPMFRMTCRGLVGL